jgi:hypothetical protein
MALTQELLRFFRGGSDNQNSNTPSQSRQSNTRQERSYTPTNNNTAPTPSHTIKSV